MNHSCEIIACLLLAALSAGCNNSMRIAHSMVEAEGIASDLKALDRAADDLPAERR
jgi:hypothetical protein